MKRIKIWIVNKLRGWLGFDKMFMGVDVGIKDESCVIICSKLGEGEIRIEDVRFGSIKELEFFIKRTQARYGILNRDVIIDKPRSMKLKI